MRIALQGLVALIFTIVVGAALSAYGQACGPAAPGTSDAGLCLFVYNYQTLLTGLIALVAALIAVAPVVRQLSLSRLQSAIMTRDVLGKRLSETEARRTRAAAALQKVTVDFERDIYSDDPEGEPKIGAEWAFYAEQTLETLLDKMRQRRESQVDPEEINVELDLIIAGVVALIPSLSDISAPARQPWDDPDLHLSEQEEKDAAAEADAAAAIAEKAIPDALIELKRRARALDLSYMRVIEKMRGRVRQLDDFILTRDL